MKRSIDLKISKVKEAHIWLQSVLFLLEEVVNKLIKV